MSFLWTKLFTATTIEITEESLARCSQLEEPTGILRLGARFTKVEQAVFLPEVNLKIYNYVSCLLGTNYELLADHNLTDSRRLVWWPRGRPLNGSMDGDAICPRDGCSPWMIRPNDGFCFQKRQVTMQERRLEQRNDVPSVRLWTSARGKTLGVFPTKCVRRMRKNNSVLAPSSGHYKSSYCI